MSSASQPYVAEATPAEIKAAYRTCREIARREARNFYYAFLALPSAKRDAICAVYAFMRHADDLADDDSQAPAVRRDRLRSWLGAWHEAAANGGSSDPVFLALAHARERFKIPLSLLDQLVEGTAMDIDPRRDHPQSLETFDTFDDLYRYCYLVASVVGLVSIRIFEYSDPFAEKLAEELGVGFQLTNILRDIREDAGRGRIYLPLEDLATYGIDPAAIVATRNLSARMPINAQLAKLLAFEATRADRFYTSGRLLLPMVAADSRPALWVLMTIYHRLLKRIERENYDVFSARISVPGYAKYWILARGLLRLGRFRLFGAR